MNRHPSDVELLNLIEGGLSAGRMAQVQDHLAVCAFCRARQSQQVEMAFQLGDVLDQAAAAFSFAPARSWAGVAPRLQNARRAEQLAAILRLAGGAVVVLLAAALTVMWWMLREQPQFDPQSTPARVAAPTAAVPAPTTPALPTASPAGRVTVLVAGMDRRPGEKGPGLTDSIMVLSLDRARHTAVILSIPRDLWVNIPGHGQGRINTAFALGETEKTGRGAALLQETAGAALGMRIDHVVRVEFGAIVKLIDAVGGVDVDVPSEINDPAFPDSAYGFDPLLIPAGRQHLDGALALKYMRTRHGSSDFARAARQQQVLAALRARLARPGAWPEFVKRVPDLVASLRDAVAADLSLGEMIDLANQAREVPDGSLRTAVLDGRYVTDYVTPEGASVLLPVKDRISALAADLLENGTAPATPETERARVRVLNGTGQAGLAARTAEWLRGQGVNVVAVDNADRQDYVATTIVDRAGRPATTRALAEWLGVGTGYVIYRPEPGDLAEIDILLGADFKPPADHQTTVP